LIFIVKLMLKNINIYSQYILNVLFKLNFWYDIF
jgi:hypothetical protein